MLVKIVRNNINKVDAASDVRGLSEPHQEKTGFLAYAKTKLQISFTVTVKLISTFVFTTRIVQFLFFLNPKSQVSSHLLSLYSSVCVRPGRKPQRPVFSRRGDVIGGNTAIIHLKPYMTNGLSHHYHLGESTLIFRGNTSDFEFLTHCSMKFLYANRLVPDGTPRFAASHLGLFCLPMSHKRDARLK